MCKASSMNHRTQCLAFATTGLASVPISGQKVSAKSKRILELFRARGPRALKGSSKFDSNQSENFAT